MVGIHELRFGIAGRRMKRAGFCIELVEFIIPFGLIKDSAEKGKGGVGSKPDALGLIVQKTICHVGEPLLQKTVIVRRSHLADEGRSVVVFRQLLHSAFPEGQLIAHPQRIAEDGLFTAVVLIAQAPDFCGLIPELFKG